MLSGSCQGKGVQCRWARHLKVHGRITTGMHAGLKGRYPNTKCTCGQQVKLVAATAS